MVCVPLSCVYSFLHSYKCVNYLASQIHSTIFLKQQVLLIFFFLVEEHQSNLTSLEIGKFRRWKSVTFSLSLGNRKSQTQGRWSLERLKWGPQAGSPVRRGKNTSASMTPNTTLNFWPCRGQLSGPNHLKFHQDQDELLTLYLHWACSVWKLHFWFHFFLLQQEKILGRWNYKHKMPQDIRCGRRHPLHRVGDDWE